MPTPHPSHRATATETIAELQERLRESPSDAGARIALARKLLETGEPGEALLYLRVAETSAAHVGEVRRLMGLAHLQSGDLSAAVDELLAAARHLPDDPAVATALEDALERFTEPEPPEQLAEAEEPLPVLAVQAPEAAEPELAEQGPEAAEPLFEPPRRLLARPAEIRPRTILLSGRGARSRASTGWKGSRPGRSAAWIGAFFVVGALVFGAVVMQRPDAVPDSPLPSGNPRAPAAAPTLPARGASERTPAEDETPAKGARRGQARAAPVAAKAGRGDRAAAQAAAKDPASSEGGGPGAAASVETEGPPELQPSPSYEFMNRIGLRAPPGAIFDPANSDLRHVGEGLPVGGRGGRPLVVTFRTGASAEEVVAFYRAQDAGLRFRWRVVPMGGKFQGVERTVARSRGRVAGGHEATITVSRPGVNPASRTLLAETTVRIELY